MADVDITSFEQLEGSAAIQEAANSKLDLARNDLAGKPFAGLSACDPDLASKYTKTYGDALDAVYDFAFKDILKKLQGYIEDLRPDPDPAPDQTDNTNNNGDNNGNVNNGDNNSNVNNNQGPVTPPPGGGFGEDPTVEDPGDIEEEELGEVNIDTSCLRDLPLKDLDGSNTFIIKELSNS